jgi:hypothetical protein
MNAENKLYVLFNMSYTRIFSKLNITKYAALAPILLGLTLIVGCATPQIKYRTVEVPIMVRCVADVPTKPERMTPCPDPINDAQCVKRAARDIERLDSALDQSINILKACQ